METKQGCVVEKVTDDMWKDGEKELENIAKKKRKE